MSTCPKCASLGSHTQPQSHSSLKRQNVRQRFFDMFETYECLDCGTHWERIILTEDKHPTRYLWKPKPAAIEPVSGVAPIDCAQLHDALLSWLPPPFNKQLPG